MLWRVLDRSRSLLLGWGLACLAAFALLALAVTQGWGPLAGVDARGGGPDVPYVEAGSRLFDLLRWIELTFGTTGMTEEDIAKVDAAAHHATIVRAGNMSLGVNLLVQLTRKVAAALDEDFKIDLSASLTAVTYAASFLYKANVGDANYPTASLDKWGPNGFGRYTPLNVSNYPSPPTVTNPSAYSVVTI